MNRHLPRHLTLESGGARLFALTWTRCQAQAHRNKPLSGSNANKTTTPRQPEPWDAELRDENCSRSCGGRERSQSAWQAWQKNLGLPLRHASMVRLLCRVRAWQREHLKNFSGG
jgi:hypothetical protein